MRAINLLPGEERGPRLEGVRTPLLVLAGSVALATAAAVFLALGASGTASDRRSELAAVQASLATLPKAPRSAVPQGVLVQERSNRTVALAAALGTRAPLDRVLRQVALVLPSDVWLTGMRVVSPVASAATAAPAAPPAPGGAAPPEGLTIEGAAHSYAGVARALSRLALVPVLEDVRLTTSMLAEQAAPSSPGPDGQTPRPRAPGKRYVTFTITASLVTGGQQ